MLLAKNPYVDRINEYFKNNLLIAHVNEGKKKRAEGMASVSKTQSDIL